MRSEDILNTALNNFRKLTGYSYKLIPLTSQKNKKPDSEDGYVECKIGNTNIRFQLEIKNEIRSMHIMPLVKIIGKERENWLIISQYIPKPVKSELRELGINYLEASGNCNIRVANIIIYINDQTIAPVRKSTKNKLWNTAGIKFILAILSNPELLNKSYREIAGKSNISISNIGEFIKELLQEKYITVDTKKEQGYYHLTNKNKLIDKWVHSFNNVLRPKLIIGRYSFVSQKIWENTGIVRGAEGSSIIWGATPEHPLIDKSKWHGIYWSGEVDAAMKTGLLTPEKITFYTTLPKEDFLKQMKLRPDEKGNVEVLKYPYKSNHSSNQLNTVPTLITYAELIDSFDSRNHEAAEIIKNKYLL